ncbi:MAG: TrmH family RNA methyltransferase [Myxococcota bacterium]
MNLQPVEDLDDPRVADYRNVRDADLRAARGLFLAEGRLNVKRLVAGGRHRTRSVFLTPAGLDGLRPALEGLPGTVPVYVAPQAVLNGVVGYDLHRGCLAAGERGALPGFDQALAREARTPRRWLALEDLTNPDNVGGAFRNALAFGVAQVLLTARCADPLYRKALRVSMGASLRLPFAAAPRWPAELATLRRAGFTVVSLVADRGAPALSTLAPARPAGATGIVLVVGNEGEGVTPGARAASDACVTIPMAAEVDSLNAATASGIALAQVAARLGIVGA